MKISEVTDSQKSDSILSHMEKRLGGAPWKAVMLCITEPLLRNIKIKHIDVTIFLDLFQEKL